MNIKDNSIIDTVIDYANIKFGVDISGDDVTAQLKNMKFSDTLKLISAIKQEDDESFAGLIDMSAVNETGYGTVDTVRPSAATVRRHDVRQDQDIRRDTNLALKSGLRNPTSNRTVAGANKVPTGRPTADTTIDQQIATAQQAQQNAQMSDKNAQEIQRLRQLINKGAGRQE